MCVWYIKASFLGHPVYISHDIWKLTHWTLTKHLLQHAAANNLLKRCIFGLASTMILHNLQIIFSQDTKKLDNTSTVNFMTSFAPGLIAETWNMTFTLWNTLRREVRKFGAQWSFLALRNTRVQKLFCAHATEEEQKMCKTSKFYKLSAPPLNNDFSHWAGVQ